MPCQQPTLKSLKSFFFSSCISKSRYYFRTSSSSPHSQVSTAERARWIETEKKTKIWYRFKKQRLCTISQNDELLPPIQHLNKSSSSKVHEQTDKLCADRNEPILDFSSFSISLCVRERTSARARSRLRLSVCVIVVISFAFAFNREKVFSIRIVAPTVGGWCVCVHSHSNYVKGVTRFPFGLF